VVERGNRDLGDALRSLLIGRPEGDWDLLLPHIMRSIRAVPHTATGETPNFMMMGRELQLPDQVMMGQVEEAATSRESYAVELSERLQVAYDALREKQDKIRAVDTQEPPLFSVGDRVWL
jgi:hypothetical protein